MNPFQAPNVGPAGKDFGNREPEVQLPSLKQVKNDMYGNERYVVHWHSVLTEKEYDDKRTYEYAVRKANKVGGRKFQNRQYGGGIVFYGNEESVIKTVMKLAQQEGVGK